MQLAGLVQQVGVHGGGADRAAMLAQQHTGFGLAFIVRGDLVARHQVDGGLAALLRRQAVARATEEHAGGSGTDHHRTAAFAAGDVGLGRLIGTHALVGAFGQFQLLPEVAVELIQQVLPVTLALGHVVQMFFHAGGEAVVHQVGEALVEALGDDVAHLLRVEATVLHRDVATLLDGGNDRRIGGRAADATLLQLLDQAGLGVTRRRLGEVLAGIQLEQLEQLAFVHFRQHVVFARLALLRQDAGVAVELEDAALGAQFELAGSDADAGGQVLGRRHLAGDELAPDQVVEALGITLHAGQLGRLEVDVGRADGLVRFLGAFLARIEVRLGRQVFLAELAVDEATHHVDGVGREVGRVGTHIGDVAGLVETLGHHHGLLHPEAQTVARRLLQGGGDERCGRLARSRLVLSLGHLVGGSLQRLDRSHGLRFGDRLEGFAALAGDLETHLGTAIGGQVGVHVPVLFGDEGADLALAIHHQLRRHRLHTAGGQAAGDLGPQQRRDHVADHAVEEATRLLGVDPVDVQLAGLGEGLLDGLLGDLVEHHALVTAVIAADGFPQVPGNGFPFAVQVGCEIDGVGILGQAAQLFDHLLLAGKDLVLGLPAMVRVDTHAGDQLALGLLLGGQGRSLGSGLATLGRLLGGTGRTTGRQVTDVADARLHHVLVAQVLVDGLGLGRGFHDDQRFAH
ncbi:hypothetical protein D3C78_653240 [compost metagenome]